MDLKQLEAFVAVSTLGSFRAAANRLNLSQPAISVRIGALEKEIGQSLFIRSRHPVALTERAKEILSHAEHMLEIAAHIRPETATRSARSSRTVRIGANSSLVAAWLPEFSCVIRREMPALSIHYEVGTSSRLREKMMAGELDVCFMYASSDWPGVRTLPLGTLRAVWAAQPGVVSTQPLRIQDAAKHLIVTFGRGFEWYSMLKTAFSEAGLWPVTLVTTNNADMIIQTIKKSPAIGTLILSSIKREVADGSLEVFKCDVEIPDYSIVCCYPLTKHSNVARKISQLAVEFVEGSEKPTDSSLVDDSDD